MSLYSQPVNKQTPTMQEGKSSSKTPENFPKQKRKKILSKEMEEGAMGVLKEMLAAQKKKSDENHEISVAAPFKEQVFMQNLHAASETKIQVTTLSPSAQVSQLFAKLVNTLTHLQREGIAETTLTLNHEAFSSSLFKGAEITISEFSTAPKAFNIKFAGNEEAVALFETHLPHLLSALKKGNFGFDVHRIDTSLLTEKADQKQENVESATDKEA